jgi:VanZ family protein
MRGEWVKRRMRGDLGKPAANESKLPMPQLLTQALSGHPDTARFWRITLALLLCAITWLSLTSVPPQQASLGWDKLNHAAAFTTLAAVALLGYGPAWLRIAAALMAYGGLIEVLQFFTVTRSAEWGDLLADAVGIGSGLLLGMAVVQVASRFDRWAQKRRT